MFKNPLLTSFRQDGNTVSGPIQRRGWRLSEQLPIFNRKAAEFGKPSAQRCIFDPPTLIDGVDEERPRLHKSTLMKVG